MTRTPKQTAQAIEDAVTEILGYRKKITDKLIKQICERNNIMPTVHASVIALISFIMFK